MTSNNDHYKTETLIQNPYDFVEEANIEHLYVTYYKPAIYKAIEEGIKKAEKVEDIADQYKYDPKYDYPPYKGQTNNTVIDYHFQENKYIKEFKKYIDSTYSKDYHYVGKGGTQATDLIIDSGHGKGFCVGNIIKYASRVGKKAGQDRKDILKILHYALILLYIHDLDKENN